MKMMMMMTMFNHWQFSWGLFYRGKLEGKNITRQYTPVSDQDCQGHFDVLIKVFLFWYFHIQLI